MQTTDEQFREFKEAFEYWVEKLGLDDWRIYITHEDYDKGTIATVQFDYDALVAYVVFQTEIEDFEESLVKPAQHAKHEALHILLGRFSGLANNRNATEKDLEREEEALVHRLQRLIQ